MATNVSVWRRARWVGLLRAGWCVVGLLIAGWFVPAALVLAQAPAGRATWKPARTVDGQPDLEGVWVNRAATPLERPAALAGRATLTDEEVARIRATAEKLFKDGNSDFLAGDNVFLAALAGMETYRNPNSTNNSEMMPAREFDNRTSLITDPPDGRVPPLTVEGRQRQAAAAQANFTLPWQIGIAPTTEFVTNALTNRALPNGPDDLSNGLRCITYGVPRLGGRFADPDFSYYRIMQAPGYAVIAAESIHDARIIPLDGRAHVGAGIRQWNGDARGRWEGDTLVVDTTNFSPKSHTMGAADGLRIVERFRRAGPDRLEYEVTLTDPSTWTKPWTVRMSMSRTDEPLFEFACHEGNHDVMTSILAGARVEEQGR